MILNRQRRVAVSLAELRTFLERVQQATGIASKEVAVCVVSDEEMAGLNRYFRGHSGPTDVLSFPADERMRSMAQNARPGRARRKVSQPVGVKQRRPGRTEARLNRERGYLGDIAISADAAQRNARERGHRFKDELRLLILHGVLHLLGYDHETDQGEMKRLEQRLRRELGLAMGRAKRRVAGR